ncbi:MAG: DUF4125 family protein [Eubacteriales bacterium]
MDINRVLQELDQLFSTHKIKEVEGFLLENIACAKSEKDVNSQVTLMNELIGYYRDLSEYQKSIDVCQTVMEVLNKSGLVGTIPYATTLQNIANALRAAGQLEASMIYYNQVFGLYQNQLEPNDMRYASLSNNMSLLYQEMGDYENACICLEKALSIVMQHPERIIEVATTHTNLGMSLLKLCQYEEAMQHIVRALDIFERDVEKDYHYSAALAAMAEAKFMAGRLEEAAYYYAEAMKEIEYNVGQTQGYKIMEQNLKMVYEQLGYVPSVVKEYNSGLALCEDFYKEYGVPMIRQQFPEYEGVIAVGLVGEGSDCFGFDDEISRDHDFGPGFCMWLTDAGYDEIGIPLQEAYDALPTVFMGIRRKNSPQAGKRVGVFRIRDFYERLIGTTDVPESNQQWLFVEDYQLASVTNGQVFRDDLGEFTRIRKGLLAYYPESVYVKKVAREATLMAQTGQYNYGRMLQRMDRVTAHIALIEFIKHTMRITYYLNRVYAPFYKWQYKGMCKLLVLQQIPELIYELQELRVGDERVPILIEQIAELIVAQMKVQGLTYGEDTYLDSHTASILASIEQKERLHITKKSKEELVEEIVCLEWETFDKVQNQGGCRADCQDNWDTFSIMRKSQFLAWNEELLQSYLSDFTAANARGWNMITEKYGRMMCSTDPEEYEKLKGYFPEISEQKAMIIEEIVKVQVSWMETFAEEYPKITAGARSIHTAEDTVFNTSYETYLRGELGTYSDHTIALYGRFIVKLFQQEENLAKQIITNTALLYGYQDLDDMEQRL